MTLSFGALHLVHAESRRRFESAVVGLQTKQDTDYTTVLQSITVMSNSLISHL